jgi:HAMP domain-containing protein
MKLLIGVNALACAILAAATLGLGVLTSHLLHDTARRNVVRQAQLMLDSAVATRAYTSAEIVPLLNAHIQTEFLPQSIPFYAATQNFLRLREQHPEYSYKEATLNPTNPRDRAMDWEADLIQQFRNEATLKELVGERDTPTGRAIYLARPIRAAAECMECHGLAESAPKALLSRYGANNGFGWALNEVVGAQVVSVPASGAEADAHRAWVDIMLAIVAVFIGLLAALDAALFFFVTRPLGRITALADAISTGNPAGDFPPQHVAELGALSRAFERMRISLEKAMKLLDS